MAKNEVGEFELVLGNKQLLSVFFIVVILLGVFFTMGYIVGRNSGGAGTLEAGNRRGGETKPTVIDSPNAPPPTHVATANEPAAAEPKKEEPPPVAVKRAETPKAEEPKKEDKAAEARKAAEDRKAEEKKAAAEKKKDEKTKAAAAAPESAPASNGALAGTYLQLAAVPKSEADLLISVLRKKGFSAAAGPGPKDSNLFRVLVGPLTADAVPSTRSSLNDAGMPGSKAIVRKF